MLLLVAALFCVPVLPLRADGPVEPPLLEFATGLSGRQVRLTWNSEPGTVYRIEKSSTLAAGGAGGWKQVALVEATAVESSWTDPEATTTKNFFRITQPVGEVFSISPPVISTTGGELVIDGQGIPAGSFLVLEFDGQTLQVPLASAGGGMWDASVVGQFLEDARVIVTSIVDSGGTQIVSLNQPITVTATGRALDSPPTLPPGAPLTQDVVNPIRGVGIVLKKNPGSSSERMGGGKVSMQDFHFAMATGRGTGKVSMQYFHFKLPSRAARQFRGEPSGTGQLRFEAVNPIPGIGIVLKHYSNSSAERKGGGLGSFGQDGLSVMRRYLASAKTSEAKNSIGAIERARPGEVHIPISSLFLACPAGPNIDWVCTYRSMVPVNTALGAGWDFSYNIFIEPLPASARASAPRVAVHDGQGRRDVFHRQLDGSYPAPACSAKAASMGKLSPSLSPIPASGSSSL